MNGCAETPCWQHVDLHVLNCSIVSSERGRLTGLAHNVWMSLNLIAADSTVLLPAA